MYGFYIMRKSDGATWGLKVTVSYISDPWVGVDVPATEQSPHLSDNQFGNPGAKRIVAQNWASLKIHSIFTTGNFNNWLVKITNGTVQTLDQNKSEYQVAAIGTYAIMVGYSGSPSYAYDVYFDVDISTIRVQSVSLNKTSLIKTVGDPAETLTVTIDPSNATNKNVSWSTSNSNVATVVDGTVSFVGVGQATITVTTEDGNKTATCNVTVNAKTYTLTATAGSGGTIFPSGSVTVNQGENQTFTATPDNGKMVDEWKVDGNVVASAGNTYTVSNVQANATVQVTFKDVPPVTFTLTATAGSGGTISPSGSVTVNQGGSQTFTATPDNGKMVDEWKVDGNVVANAGDTYMVSNVQANATVQVTFKDVPPVEESLFSIFDGLEGEYTQSSVVIQLKLKGNDSEKFTIFKVNGGVKSEFIPNVKGSFKIEAITADGKSRIETYVNVK
jgi:hypothetical protein